MLVSELLLRIGSLPSTHPAFLEDPIEWRADKRAIVLDLEELDDPDAEIVTSDGVEYIYALQVATIEDVVANATMQNPAADQTTLLRAVEFYFDHDAFVEIETG
jgi:hypothetical protein